MLACGYRSSLMTLFFLKNTVASADNNSMTNPTMRGLILAIPEDSSNLWCVSPLTSSNTEMLWRHQRRAIYITTLPFMNAIGSSGYKD
jgi:hypothetical protein